MKSPNSLLLFLVAFPLCAPAQGVGIGTRIDLTQKLQLGSGQFAQLFVPDYFVTPANGEFTLVFHLHSASWAAEDEVYKSHTNAILFNIHLGSFSSSYQTYFSNQAYFQDIVDTILSVLRAGSIIPNPAVGSLIVTSFSAGYAGVREIFKTPTYYSQIDALTLADGLHCSSDPPTMVVQMQDFVRFAMDARNGNKVFLLTHSSITTVGYENTTQTADYLISHIGTTRISFSAIDSIGQQFSSADTGFFHLRGYFGTTAIDHLRHLYNMHVMLRAADSLVRSGTVHVKESQSKPEGFRLFQNYPNPFNPTTIIPYQLSSSGHVNLELFDVLGRRIRVLVDDVVAQGRHEIDWNGTNELGSPVSAGTYLCRLNVGSSTETRMMTFLK